MRLGRIVDVGEAGLRRGIKGGGAGSGEAVAGFPGCGRRAKAVDRVGDVGGISGPGEHWILAEGM